MANRYWVGGTGTWDASSTTHWSATSGGASGASVPTSADSVFVDALSGSSPVITVSATGSCLDLNFTGAITPTLAGTSTILVYGSVTQISTLIVTKTGSYQMMATSTGKTITTAGVSMATGFQFSGIGGGWTFLDDVTAATIFHTDGTLDLNGKNFTLSSNFSSINNLRTLTFGTATLNVAGNFTADNTTMTFNAGTSTINMTGASKTFAGGGLTYYNVNAVGNTLTVSGSNTFNLFTPTAGNTVIFTISTTNTALTNFVFKNNTIRSTVAGTAFTLSKSTGVVIFRNCSIKDCTATGGASFSAIRGSVSVSGNTGITFGSYVVVEKQLDGRKYVLNASGVLTAL